MRKGGIEDVSLQRFYAVFSLTVTLSASQAKCPSEEIYRAFCLSGLQSAVTAAEEVRQRSTLHQREKMMSNKEK